jgi:hypothetical protein
MEVLGVGPHETWMVGDNLEWEVVSPQRLGIYAIWHDGYGVGLPSDCPIRPDRHLPPVGIAAVAEQLGLNTQAACRVEQHGDGLPRVEFAAEKAHPIACARPKVLNGSGTGAASIAPFFIAVTISGKPVL